MQPAQPAAAQTLLTVRILFFAMIGGVLAFGAVVVVVLKPVPGGDPSVLLTALVLLAAGLAVAWFVVGRLLRRRLGVRLAAAAQDEGTAALHRGFFTASVVGAAMAEAYCFFALAVFMLTGVPMALVAAGAGLLALLVQLPTADRFHRFTEEVQGHGPS